MSFEYYGWIKVVPSDWDDPEPEEWRRREAEVSRMARDGVATFRDRIPGLTVVTDAFDGAKVIHMHGALKHGPGQATKEFFAWAAENLQVSYGLLYYCDSEAGEEGDQFFVVRLAAGECTTHRDSLLSPKFDVVDLSRPPDDKAE